jgi:hypothetical protein
VRICYEARSELVKSLESQVPWPHPPDLSTRYRFCLRRFKLRSYCLHFGLPLVQQNYGTGRRECTPWLRVERGDYPSRSTVGCLQFVIVALLAGWV